MKRELLFLTGSALAVAACAHKPDLPAGQQAYAIIPPPKGTMSTRDYRIGPLDTIAVTVFQEPDLTVKDIEVDASGALVLPLVGKVQAAGQTSSQLATTIAASLAKGYLVNPQVSVVVQESVSQRVTVEGSVTDPGVFAIRGRTTLLDALAMAKGTSRVAALDNVAIFREIDGKRSGALFNVAQIQRGEMQDPEILGNDTVVVGLSNIKAAWRDVLLAAPLIATFRAF